MKGQLHQGQKLEIYEVLTHGLFPESYFDIVSQRVGFKHKYNSVMLLSNDFDFLPMFPTKDAVFRQEVEKCGYYFKVKSLK